MKDLGQFIASLGKVQFGDLYSLLTDHPNGEVGESRSVLVVGIDPERASVQIVDYHAFERALHASKPLVAVGKGVAAVKGFFTGADDKEFSGKADKAATEARHAITRTTVHATWLPHCWIQNFKKLAAANADIIEALKETHPPIGFEVKK